MRSFASAIDKPMLFQISDELPNLTRHMRMISPKGKTAAMQDRVYEECRYTFHGRPDAFGAVDLEKPAAGAAV
jgi:hypothetical protein